MKRFVCIMLAVLLVGVLLSAACDRAPTAPLPIDPPAVEVEPLEGPPLTPDFYVPVWRSPGGMDTLGDTLVCD